MKNELQICKDVLPFWWVDFVNHITIWNTDPITQNDTIKFSIYKFPRKYTKHDIELYLSLKFNQDYTVDIIHGANGDNTYEAFPTRLYCRVYDIYYAECEILSYDCSGKDIKSLKDSFEKAYKEFSELQKQLIKEVIDEPCISDPS